jgi:6-oxo-cyclohex-1-ene-carbonyl-CoA hydrolase
VTKAVPIKKDAQGNWVPNPLVITDTFCKDGQIVYGEPKTGKDLDEAKALMKDLTTDMSRFDAYLNNMIWTLANTMPLCLMKGIETVRIKKRSFWDDNKVSALYGLANGMNAEAWIGFNAFNMSSVTGTTKINFLELRRAYAAGESYSDALLDKVFYPVNKK